MSRAGQAVTLREGDALILVDVQNDFLPGGALAVDQGDCIIPVLNQAIALFSKQRLPIYATRDWHPPNHCSFADQGGPWPVHCVADTPGAAFAPALKLPRDTVIISKAQLPDYDAYSGFEGTDLPKKLDDALITRVVVGGLATDYCVLFTVLSALLQGMEVYVLADGVRAVNIKAHAGELALQRMRTAGAHIIRLEDVKS